MLKPIILVRRTIDWGNITVNEWLDDFKRQNSKSRKKINLEEDVSKEMMSQFFANIKTWHETFPITYPEYRTELKKIALSNWERMGCDIVDMPESIDDLKKRFHGYLLFPTDDDDWFDPQITELFPQLMGEQDFGCVTWDAVRYNRLGKKEEFYTDRRVGSNAYCFDCESASLQSLLVHHKVPHTNRIMKPYSVWVRHRASYWNLQNYSLSTDCVSDVECPNDLKWAREEVNALRKIDDYCVSNSLRIKLL